MLLRLAIFCFVVLCSLGSAAQLQVSGIILDELYGGPAVNVNIRVKGTSLSTNTDAEGRFRLKISDPAERIDLVVTSLAYVDTVFTNVAGGRKSGNIEVSFALLPELYEYSPVVVSAHPKPDTVWSSEQWHVVDFAFQDDGMILLTSESELRWKRQEESKETLYQDCVLIYTDSLMNELARLTLDIECKSLYTDYFNDVFLFARKGIYAVMSDSTGLRLDPIEQSLFDDYVRPVVDSLDNKLILSSFDPSFPAFEYASFDRRDSTYSRIRYLIDEHMMEMFRSEFKYLHPRDKLAAFRYEVKYGVDKEIVAAYMSGFQHSPYYEPLNAPLLVSRDTLLIFDHSHDKLIRFDGFGQAADSSDISYHRLKQHKWSGKLYADDSSGEIYTLHEKAGKNFLSRINRVNGSVEDTFELYYKYVSNIAIRNGVAYYIYRPFESAQKKFLYSERIRM